MTVAFCTRRRRPQTSRAASPGNLWQLDTLGEVVWLQSQGAATGQETTFAKHKDPYILDQAHIQEPPTRFGQRLKFLGPGMITSAAVVGSGELLTATALGAQVGFMLFWLVLVSTFV